MLQKKKVKQKKVVVQKMVIRMRLITTALFEHSPIFFVPSSSAL